MGKRRILILSLVLLLLFAPPVSAIFSSLERMVGESAYHDLVAEYGGVADLRAESATYLEEMFEQVVQANPRHDVPFSVTPLNSTPRWVCVCN